MACSSCTKNRKSVNEGIVTSYLKPHPLRATDIAVIDSGEIRKFEPSDWSNSNHKLLIIIPEAFTPVCQTELGSLNKWVEKFQDLGCEIIAVSSDPVLRLKEWFESEQALANPSYKIFSSYLLPSRLGLMENGRPKRSSVFIMSDGEVVKQEHFSKVGRSFAELHRMLYGYTTDSYCAEGWQSPEDGFLSIEDVS